MNITIEDEGREIQDIQSEYIAGLKKQNADLEDDLNAAIDDVKDKDKRIAELEARLKESGRIMAQLAEAAEDDGVDGVRWRAIAGDAYAFLNAPEGNADD